VRAESRIERKREYSAVTNIMTVATRRYKGLRWSRSKLADGSVRTYYYAWKNGPRLQGKPGTAEFEASWREAHAIPPRQNLLTATGDHVYFIKIGQAIKIGFSNKLRQRIADFQTTTAEPIEVLAFFPGTRALEHRLHSLFWGLRIRNELFRDHPDIRCFIKLAIINSIDEAIEAEKMRQKLLLKPTEERNAMEQQISEFQERFLAEGYSRQKRRELDYARKLAEDLKDLGIFVTIE
jgi:hypothetical protein